MFVMANAVTDLLNLVFNPHRSPQSSTGAALADQLLGTNYNQNSQFNAALRTNIDEAEKQRLWNEKMWNLNNEYNSPIAQMERVRAAGLNPSLLYGQPIAESQPASGGAEASSPSVANRGVLSDIVSPQSLAQIDLMRAQAEEIRSRIPLNQQRTSNLSAQYNDILASVKQRLADIALKGSQTALNDEQRKNISFEQMFKSNQLLIDYHRLQNENALTSAQVENIEANTREVLARAGVEERQLQEMLYTFAIRKAGLEKQNLLTDAQILQANSTAAKLEKEGIHIQQLIDIDSPQFINSKTWADDMSGKNGKLNQVGSNITYQFMNTLERLGSFVIKL